MEYGSSGAKKEFKLDRSELDDDLFAEDDLAADEFKETQSPTIRVQTTTFNKSSQHKLEVNETVSMNDTVSLTNHSSMNMGGAAYTKEYRRPSQTAGAQRRMTLKTSQVIMMPIDPLTYPVQGQKKRKRSGGAAPDEFN